MDTRAEALLGRPVSPVKSAQKKVYTDIVSDIVDNFCLRNTELVTDPVSEAVVIHGNMVESDTFRVGTEEGLRIFRIPSLEEFIKTTRMRCIGIHENGMIIVSLQMTFREGIQQATHKYVEKRNCQWEPNMFTVSQKLEPSSINRINKYFS